MRPSVGDVVTAIPVFIKDLDRRKCLTSKVKIVEFQDDGLVLITRLDDGPYNECKGDLLWKVGDQKFVHFDKWQFMIQKEGESDE